MVIVMPRCFSSGALSICSKGTYEVFGLSSASTLVMAAVSVVLPWSMCPMVPTFTWGFTRSNFFLAISSELLPDLGRSPFGTTAAAHRLFVSELLHRGDRYRQGQVIPIRGTSALTLTSCSRRLASPTPPEPWR